MILLKCPSHNRFANDDFYVVSQNEWGDLFHDLVAIVSNRNDIHVQLRYLSKLSSRFPARNPSMGRNLRLV